MRSKWLDTGIQGLCVFPYNGLESWAEWIAEPYEGAGHGIEMLYFINYAMPNETKFN